MAIYQALSAADETALRARAAAGEPVIQNLSGLDVAMTDAEVATAKQQFADAQAAADAAAKAPKPVSIPDQLAKITAALVAAKIPIPS